MDHRGADFTIARSARRRGSCDFSRRPLASGSVLGEGVAGVTQNIKVFRLAVRQAGALPAVPAARRMTAEVSERPCRRDCPFLFSPVDRWRPLRSAAGCSRTLPGGGVRRRARRGWHVIAKCEDGNSGHHDPDDKCRQEPSAAVSVTERSLSVGVQAWIGLLRLSELSVGRLAIDHSFPLPVVGPTRL
jgi:hypothetical protein